MEGHTSEKKYAAGSGSSQGRVRNGKVHCLVKCLNEDKPQPRNRMFTSDLTNSGSSRSLAAQKAISSVITPLRA